MTPISFVIPGAPVGKERARAVVRGVKRTNNGKLRPSIGHYTPGKTATWERMAGIVAKVAMRGKAPFEGAVRLNLQIILPIPPSWPAWKRELALRGEIYPTVKPDGDNVEKATKDALNRIVWADDCQVIGCDKWKAYGASPCVNVTVTPLAGHTAQIVRKP